MDGALGQQGLRAHIAATVVADDDELTGIERDLIKQVGLRSGTARLLAAVEARRTELEARAASVAALSERCRSRPSSTNPPPAGRARGRRARPHRPRRLTFVAASAG